MNVPKAMPCCAKPLDATLVVRAVQVSAAVRSRAWLSQKTQGFSLSTESTGALFAPAMVPIPVDSEVATLPREICPGTETSTARSEERYFLKEFSLEASIQVCPSPPLQSSHRHSKISGRAVLDGRDAPAKSACC